MSKRRRIYSLFVCLLVIAPTGCDRSGATGKAGGGGDTSGSAVDGWREFPIPGLNASVQMPGKPTKNTDPSEKNTAVYIANSLEGPFIEVEVRVFTPDIA